MMIEVKGGTALVLLVLACFVIGSALYLGDFAGVQAFLDKPAKDATMGEVIAVLAAASIFWRKV